MTDLRADIFDALRLHDVSEQCFSEIAAITQRYKSSAENGQPQRPASDDAMEADDLRAEVTRLKALGDGLARFTDHDAGCGLFDIATDYCTCGLSTALAAWEKKDG